MYPVCRSEFLVNLLLQSPVIRIPVMIIVQKKITADG